MSSSSRITGTIAYAALTGLGGGLFGWMTEIGKDYVNEELKRWRETPSYELDQEFTYGPHTDCKAEPSGSVTAALDMRFAFTGPGVMDSFVAKPYLHQPQGWHLTGFVPTKMARDSGNMMKAANGMLGQLPTFSNVPEGGEWKIIFCFAGPPGTSLAIDQIRLDVDAKARTASCADALPFDRGRGRFWLRHFAWLAAGGIFLAALVALLTSVHVLRAGRRGLDLKSDPGETK